MTGTISHRIDDKRQGGSTGRTEPLGEADPVRALDPSTSVADHRKARGVITHAIDGSIASRPLFCPP